MIDGTEKPEISSKFAKRPVRYNEFGNQQVLPATIRHCERAVDSEEFFKWYYINKLKFEFWFETSEEQRSDDDFFEQKRALGAASLFRQKSLTGIASVFIYATKHV